MCEQKSDIVVVFSEGQWDLQTFLVEPFVEFTLQFELLGAQSDSILKD